MAISIDLYFDKSAHEIKEIKRQRAEMLEYYRKERPERLTPELEAELTAEPTLQNNQLVDILSHSTHERLPDEVQAAFIRHLMNQRSAANKTERQRKKAGFSSGEQRQDERQPVWDEWQRFADQVWAKNPRLSQYEVARRIAEQHNLEDKPDTIRKRITKPLNR